MPLVHIHLGRGRATYEQKKELIARVTDTFVDVLGSDKDKVWVVLHEVPRSEWGIGGKPIAEPDR
ncbi:MAG: 4-oxalocrotonate tautomerase family protein [Burkholderiales bacterium]|nr:4-oxalocrotonate tautomerase family protein [Burkholderiales bacterium]GIK86795.1 MAG: tautomerase [Betaproteobacteria bacterium]